MGAQLAPVSVLHWGDSHKLCRPLDEQSGVERTWVVNNADLANILGVSGMGLVVFGAAMCGWQFGLMAFGTMLIMLSYDLSIEDRREE